MRKLILLYILLLLCIGSSSCQRHDMLMDCSCSNRAKIPIAIDWTKSGIVPKNVTILFYKEDCGSLAFEHNYEHNDKEVETYVYLPVGKYTAVVFNELRNEINDVKVKGYKNLSTLGFYADEDTEIIERSAGMYVEEPDILGLKVIRNIDITPEFIADLNDKGSTNDSSVIDSTYNMLTNIEPENKVSLINIVLHVKGLNNARMPALIDLRNISGAYMPAEDINNTTPAVIQFDMNNRIYNTGSTTEGNISGEIAFFGVLGDRYSVEDQPTEAPIILDVLFMLVDKKKTLIRQKLDITDLITFDVVHTGSITLTTDIHLDVALPDVEPEGGSDSGFGSGLNDWDIIDVPL